MNSTFIILIAREKKAPIKNCVLIESVRIVTKDYINFLRSDLLVLSSLMIVSNEFMDLIYNISRNLLLVLLE